mgnify:CR=1 FL=1
MFYIPTIFVFLHKAIILLKTPNKKSALSEIHGVEQPETLSTVVASQIQQFRRKQPSAEELIAGILIGDKTALSRAITLVESTNPEHLVKANEVIKGCLPHANNSVRIGITGVPGVGKSTFIEAFGMYLLSQGKTLAVLAVDPSSEEGEGSILGDKTRMYQLSQAENAFIRPSPSGKNLGGVTRKTRESIVLCEAAGFDVIIIETVGVGQSETLVHSMVDFFLLLMLAGAGDELQGIKRGIIEMADTIVINKADGNNLTAAKIAKVEFNRALHFYPAKTSGWAPKVVLCSALENKGIDTTWNLISDYMRHANKESYFAKKRQEQNNFWLLQTIENQLKDRFWGTRIVFMPNNSRLKPKNP